MKIPFNINQPKVLAKAVANSDFIFENFELDLIPFNDLANLLEKTLRIMAIDIKEYGLNSPVSLSLIRRNINHIISYLEDRTLKEHHPHTRSYDYFIERSKQGKRYEEINLRKPKIKILNKYLQILESASHLVHEGISTKNLKEVGRLVSRLPKEYLDSTQLIKPRENSTSLFVSEPDLTNIEQLRGVESQSTKEYDSKERFERMIELGSRRFKVAEFTYVQVNPEVLENSYLYNEAVNFLKTAEEKIKESYNKVASEIAQLEVEINSIDTFVDEYYKLNHHELSEEKFRQYHLNLIACDPERNFKIVRLKSLRKRLVGEDDEIGEILPFEIFPVGNWTTGKMSSFLAKTGYRLSENQIARLDLIRNTFRPDRFALGKQSCKGYEGYFVFIFDEEQKVIVENPIYGNATYLIAGSWDEVIEILKLSKQEVRKQSNTDYVIHQYESQWLRELQNKFRML